MIIRDYYEVSYNLLNNSTMYGAFVNIECGSESDGTGSISPFTYSGDISNIQISPQGNYEGKIRFTYATESSTDTSLSFTCKVNGYALSIDAIGTIYPIDLDEIASPVISENSGYPIITEYGIKYVLNITYDDRDDIINYYSTDGTTWNEYTGFMDVSSGTIYAKSVKKTTGLVSEITSYTVETPSNALGINAFDGDNNTFHTYTYPSTNLGIMYISEEMQGKKMNLYFTTNGAGYNGGIRFYTEDGTYISSVSVSANGTYNGVTSIPENAAYFYCFKENGGGQVYMREVSPYTGPSFSKEAHFAEITLTGINQPYNLITISYNDTAVKEYYRINSGEWETYSGVIKLTYGDKIEAKSIDKYGNDSQTTSYTSTVTNALTSEAYDGDNNTYYTYTYPSTNLGIMYISEEMQGKKMNLYFTTNGAGYNGGIRFYTEDGTYISSVSVSANGTYNGVASIPENAAYFYCFKENGGGQVYMREVSPVINTT